MDNQNNYNRPEEQGDQPEAQINAKAQETHDESEQMGQQTPYQVPVRSSQDVGEQSDFTSQSSQRHDSPIYNDHAHDAKDESAPFRPGTESYKTYQQWQDQNAKTKSKKPRSKTPLIIFGGVAAAIALFFGGVTVGGFANSNSGSSITAGRNESLPVLSIANTPTDSEKASSKGELSGEAIYSKVNESVVAIQSANASAREASSGSGVVMSPDGYIVTNAHVITDESTGQAMTNISVLFSDGTQLPAEVKGYDAQTDLAVIKVQPKTELAAAEFGDSDALQVGQAAYAIGSPGGVQLANSMTNGIISAINRDITVNDRVMSLIQTNVTINPGNSGGALINKYGQVVGITSAKLGISYYEGLGFAIPINSAKQIVDELIQNGYISGRPSIGITGSNISAQIAQYRNLPQGVEVASVDSRAKAASEGLQAGDIITAVNGKAITTMNEINEVKGDLKAGDTLVLTVFRPTTQKALDLRITLTDAHDIQGADPAQQKPKQQYQQEIPSSGNQEDSGYFDPFQYFFGN